MWLEVKLLISCIALIFIAIVLSQILLLNFFLGFLLIIGIGMVLLSDIVISYQIKHNHVDKLIDPCPSHRELTVVHTLTGLIDFVWSKKAPQGKREFVYNNQDASYINNGDYPIHTINGNFGSVVHESHDENINFFDVKFAEDICKEYGVENIKDLYHKIKYLEKRDMLDDEGKIKKEN